MRGVLSGREDELSFGCRPSWKPGGIQIAASPESDPRQDWRVTLVHMRGNTSPTGRIPVWNYEDGA